VNRTSLGERKGGGLLVGGAFVEREEKGEEGQAGQAGYFYA